MPYLGLLRQRGPFHETKEDIRHVYEKDTNWVGGGVPVGGSVHAGHGFWSSTMNPADKSPMLYVLPKGEPVPIVVPQPFTFQTKGRMGARMQVVAQTRPNPNGDPKQTTVFDDGGIRRSQVPVAVEHVFMQPVQEPITDAPTTVAMDVEGVVQGAVQSQASITESTIKIAKALTKSTFRPARTAAELEQEELDNIVANYDPSTRKISDPAQTSTPPATTSFAMPGGWPDTAIPRVKPMGISKKRKTQLAKLPPNAGANINEANDVTSVVDVMNPTRESKTGLAEHNPETLKKIAPTAKLDSPWGDDILEKLNQKTAEFDGKFHNQFTAKSNSYRINIVDHSALGPYDKYSTARKSKRGGDVFGEMQEDAPTDARRASLPEPVWHGKRTPSDTRPKQKFVKGVPKYVNPGTFNPEKVVTFKPKPAARKPSLSNLPALQRKRQGSVQLGPEEVKATRTGKRPASLTKALNKAKAPTRKSARQAK